MFSKILSPLKRNDKEKTPPPSQKKAEVLNKVRGFFAPAGCGLVSKLKNIFSTGTKVDEHTIEDIEALLIESDFSAQMTNMIVQKLQKLKLKEDVGYDVVKNMMSESLQEILQPLEGEILVNQDDKPFVIVACGINGSGKTTSIGKLAKKLSDDGKKVLLVACDTFRAAASEQLKVWSNRSNCKIIVAEQDGIQPAAVAYKGMEVGISEKYDVVIIDTAGRLQTQNNLMEELSKIYRVVTKLTQKDPQESIIVLDATIGQNASSQIKEFNKYAKLTGVIITKLDTSSRGGAAVSAAHGLNISIKAICTGEGIEDIHNFNAKDFTDDIFDND